MTSFKHNFTNRHLYCNILTKMGVQIWEHAYLSWLPWLHNSCIVPKQLWKKDIADNAFLGRSTGGTTFSPFQAFHKPSRDRNVVFNKYCVFRASHLDASWTPGMSNWKETPGKTQDKLEVLYLRACLGSPRKSWKMLRVRGKSGSACWVCCLREYCVLTTFIVYRS